MIFGKKKEKELLEKLERQELSQSYWAIVKRQFRKNRIAVWSLRFLFVIFLIALFGDFIANEKPIYCKIGGKTHFPIFKQYAVDLGIGHWEAEFFQKGWKEHDYEKVIFPPIPYSSLTIDRGYTNFAEPQSAHWLGTDQLGRDVATGMISGTRTAMLVGVIAMSIASFIGIFFGALAGYFGDNRFRISRIRLVLNIFGLGLGYFYGFATRSYALNNAGENFGFEILKSIFIVIVIFLLLNLLSTLLKRITTLSKKVTLPLDIIVMRIIEVMNSIPILLIILAAIAMLQKPSIFHIMVIIGLLRWTGIARFIRAELLRVRSLNYVEAAQAMGFGELRIILRHAIPNALTPVLITIAFGIASAILLEAFISFLIPFDNEITWGSLLREARQAPTAWWLAIFPGLAIFITVTLFNLIGEGLTEALDPKLRQ